MTHMTPEFIFYISLAQITISILLAVALLLGNIAFRSLFTEVGVLRDIVLDLSDEVEELKSELGITGDTVDDEENH
jgi:hypothetical protein